jgi:hypothetical protein
MGGFVATARAERDGAIDAGDSLKISRHVSKMRDNQVN